jgi:DNA-directed RNA polymerase specialized sigma24 family protein
VERTLVEDARLELIDRDSQSDLQRALWGLPVEQRQAIERRALEEESYAATAISSSQAYSDPGR